MPMVRRDFVTISDHHVFLVVAIFVALFDAMEFVGPA